jgi:hypothetical protein
MTELAWLRQESPSAAVIEHIEMIWKEENLDEVELMRETIRRTSILLESLDGQLVMSSTYGRVHEFEDMEGSM